MDNATLYEYKISKGKFIQIVHEAEVTQTKSGTKFYVIYVFHPKRKLEFGEKDLDVISDSHLFSLSDNIEEAKQRFEEYYRALIDKENKKIEKYQNLINQINNGEGKPDVTTI